jgi:hypothetical protein
VLELRLENQLTNSTLNQLQRAAQTLEFQESNSERFISTPSTLVIYDAVMRTLLAVLLQAFVSRQSTALAWFVIFFLMGILVLWFAVQR